MAYQIGKKKKQKRVFFLCNILCVVLLGNFPFNMNLCGSTEVNLSESSTLDDINNVTNNDFSKPDADLDQDINHFRVKFFDFNMFRFITVPSSSITQDFGPPMPDEMGDLEDQYDFYTSQSTNYFLMFPFTLTSAQFTIDYIPYAQIKNENGDIDPETKPVVDITVPVNWVVNFGGEFVESGFNYITDYFFNYSSMNPTKKQEIENILNVYKASNSSLADNDPFYVWRIGSMHYFKVYYHSTDEGKFRTQQSVQTNQLKIIRDIYQNLLDSAGDYRAWTQDGFSDADDYSYNGNLALNAFTTRTVVEGQPEPQFIADFSVILLSRTAVLEGGIILFGEPLGIIEGDKVATYFFNPYNATDEEKKTIKKNLLALFKNKRTSAPAIDFWEKTLYVWRPGSDACFEIHFDFMFGMFFHGPWSEQQPALAKFDTALGVDNPTLDLTTAFRGLLDAQYEWNMIDPFLYIGEEPAVSLTGAPENAYIFKNVIPIRKSDRFDVPSNIKYASVPFDNFTDVYTYLLDNEQFAPIDFTPLKNNLEATTSDTFYLWYPISGYYLEFYYNGFKFVINQDSTVALNLYAKANTAFDDDVDTNVALNYKITKNLTSPGVKLETKGSDTSERNLDALERALSAILLDPERTLLRGTILTIIADQIRTKTIALGVNDPVAAAISTALTATTATANGLRDAIRGDIRGDIASKITANTTDDPVAVAISTALTATEATANGLQNAVRNVIPAQNVPTFAAIRGDIAEKLWQNTAPDPVAAAIFTSLTNTKPESRIPGFISSTIRHNIGYMLKANTVSDGKDDPVAAAISTALTATVATANGLQNAITVPEAQNSDDAKIAAILATGPQSQLAVSSIVCKAFNNSTSNDISTVITNAVQAAIMSVFTASNPTTDQNAFKSAIINSIATAIADTSSGATAIAGTSSDNIQTALVNRMSAELSTGRLYETVNALYQTSLTEASNQMLTNVANDLMAQQSTLVPKIASSIQNSAALQQSIQKVISDAIRITNDTATDLKAVLENKITSTYPASTILSAVVNDIANGASTTSQVLNAIAKSISSTTTQGSVSSDTIKTAIQSLA